MIGSESGSGTTSKRFSSKDDDGPVPNPPALTIVFSAGGGVAALQFEFGAFNTGCP